MIDRDTGALVLPDGRIERELTRSSLLSSLLAKGTRSEDMQTGWAQVYLKPRRLGGREFGVHLVFEGERLDSYALSLHDPQYGTSWDDWSEAKELARRNAHDAWLEAGLGKGKSEGAGRARELRYTFPWGRVWSSFDPKGGASSIGVRFRRLEEATRVR